MNLIAIRPSAVNEKPTAKPSKPAARKRFPSRKTKAPLIDVRSLFPGHSIGATLEHGPHITCRYARIYACGRRLVVAVPDDKSPAYNAVRVVLNNSARVTRLVDPPRVREHRWSFPPKDFGRVADIVVPLIA
jgi:hypothetical protein